LHRPPHGATAPQSGHPASRGGGASVGHVDGNVELTINNYMVVTAMRPARSAYRRQVERIAPLQLLDRDAELAELAGFCLEEARGSYLWWRAGPWAGKSALLSTFVLSPPEPVAAGGVVLVSFFITARLAGQDTREAFTATLIEQLCTLLGVELPVAANEGAREAALLDLLAEAAAVCRQAGGRLVLVVDGLDEDRGVTAGPGAHSIAALLPSRPPAGMRVIVAGRPNPPIPEDVPAWHPLRDPGIVRLLGTSPHARDLQRLGESELKRLLKGSRVEQDLLGLLTAARGGLSGPDLRELTGVDLVDVEETLHTVAGRSFTRRLAAGASADGPQVYMLGHEELHNAASHYLGSGRMADYRDRLRAWAEGYRVPSDGRPPWPPRTPEYLLTDYPRMLASTGDTDRLTELAIDPARHDRMLDLTGGDTAALNEIATCQDLLLDCPQPDLYALARLSHHRNQLESRNAKIPTQLPAVWATLGQPNRAEALARSLTYPKARVESLAMVAVALAGAGNQERARDLAIDAERIARTIDPYYEQAGALAVVAETLAGTGDHQRVERIAHSLTDPEARGRALAAVVAAVAAAGDRERAERIARTHTDPYEQAMALTAVAAAMAAAGDHEHALGLAAEAERIAHTCIWYLRDRALAAVAEAAARSGDLHRVERIVGSLTSRDTWGRAVAEAAEAAGEQERSERIARSLTDPKERDRALAAVAEAAAGAGDRERAERIARTLTSPYEQAMALAAVAAAVAAAGDHERGRSLAIDAERIAHTITDPDKQAREVVAVAGAVAAAGDRERAERIARTLTSPYEQARALAAMAAAVAAAGEYERAEQIARTIDPTASYVQVEALAAVIGPAAAAGDYERARDVATEAERIAHTITYPYLRDMALNVVAKRLAEAGDHEYAEQIVGTLSPFQATESLAAVAGAVAAAGDHERAERIARTLTSPYEQAMALAAVAAAMAAAGDHERARDLATDTEQIARTVADPQQSWALAAVAGAVAAAGDHERAEQIARTIINPSYQARALATLAEVVAGTGDRERLATDAERIARTITSSYLQAKALITVAEIVGLPRAGRLLGEALALESWWEPLSALAKILSQEVIRIVDAIYVDKRLVVP
jgi:hypothetical protein